jgi:hypothetical protein
VIIEVEEVDYLVPVAEIVSPEIDLDSAGGILEVPEDDLPFGTPAFDSSGNGHFRSVISHFVLVSGQSGGCHVGAFVPIRKGLNPKRLERGPLLSSSDLDI